MLVVFRFMFWMAINIFVFIEPPFEVDAGGEYRHSRPNSMGATAEGI
ncbi:MAG: hypothetical protein ACKVOF_02840 [Pseudohongiellaceae bacterium]